MIILLFYEECREIYTLMRCVCAAVFVLLYDGTLYLTATRAHASTHPSEQQSILY